MKYILNLFVESDSIQKDAEEIKSLLKDKNIQVLGYSVNNCDTKKKLENLIESAENIRMITNKRKMVRETLEKLFIVINDEIMTRAKKGFYYFDYIIDKNDVITVKALEDIIKLLKKQGYFVENHEDFIRINWENFICNFI